MKKIFSITLTLFISFQINAQIIWSDNFDTNNWTLNVIYGLEDIDPNSFVVSSQAEGGTTDGCLSTGNLNSSLYVSGYGGANYDPGGFLSFSTTTNRGAVSPTINCNGVTNLKLMFNYFEGGDDTTDNATLWYYDGISWSLLDDMPKTLFCSANQIPQWTYRVVTLPPSANNNPNVRLAFRWVNNSDGVGTQPSLAVDNMLVMSTTNPINSITTSATNNDSVCLCSKGIISYSSSAAFNSGNIFTVELSDAFGSFASPMVIGTQASTNNTDLIGITYPCTLPLGSGYRVRVISSNPVIIGTDNGSNIIIPATTYPAVSISYTPSGLLCTGMSITLTATITNAGLNPWFYWGGYVSGNNTTITTTNLQNGYTAIAYAYSSDLCPLSPIVTDTVTFTILPSPFISMSVLPNNNICTGSYATLTAIGIGVQSFQWVPAITNGVPFIPTSNGIYTVVATGSNGCTASMTTPISLLPVPTVTASVQPTSPVCAGSPVILNGVGATSYTWSGGVNNNVSFVPLATTTYTVTGIDSSTGCGSTASVQVVVNPMLTPTITLSTLPSPVVTGQNATFTANIGGATSYQINWYKGGAFATSTNSPNNQYTTFIGSLSDSVYAYIIPVGCYNPDSTRSAAIYPQFPMEVNYVLPFDMEVYPNPTSENLNIRNAQHVSEITMRNLVGEVVQRWVMKESIASIQLPISKFESGLYILEMKIEDKIYNYKLAVNNSY
jgi:Secretion system C-terminal sorting domain